MAKVAPSVLAADFSRLADEIKKTEVAGVDLLHLDIMDGHFVPNISFGPSIVKTIDRLTGLFLDVHLMLSNPEAYFEPFIKAGADSITFHLEARPNPIELAARLKETGVEAGISINPDTDPAKVLPFLEHFDLLLVMSVFPGFGGQSFIESALDSVSAARNHIDQHGLATKIAIDGGVDGDNAARIVAAGADILVMGTAFFRNEDQKTLTQKTQALRR
ncbi:MAG: ribulose-phosphate 3-epimerase [candidate division Zixibacteria bacterium]|nr:ribulose-phosphate 3-epimerase [candidate division Zixibacteria bacterium]